MSSVSESTSPTPQTTQTGGKKDPPVPMLPPSAFTFKDASMDIVLEDLSSRFILNLPDAELMTAERVCFQVEQAHWYYEDFVRMENPSLPSMALKSFSLKLFDACPLLERWRDNHDQAFAEFVKYKTSVPVCGAILLNHTWDKCVLVKGWKASAAWGFPRGKINENEPLHACAAREVLEETGFPCEDKLRQDAFVSSHGKEQQNVTLYIVPNVPEDYPFLTRTRKEISKIAWFNVRQLPGWNVDEEEEEDDDEGNPIKTWSVAPFVSQLKRRLTYFQVLFGYVPPEMSSKRLKEYRRIHRSINSPHNSPAFSHANSHSSPASTGKGRNRLHPPAMTQAPTPALLESIPAEDESTGAEGDDEPETETDHDKTDGTHGSPEVNANGISTNFHPNSNSRVSAVVGPSAIDALFTKTIQQYDNAGGSSPDLNAASSRQRIAKGPKQPRNSGRNRVSSSATITANLTQPPRVLQDPPIDPEKQHFANLMQSLVLSSTKQTPSAITQGTSGLPTPMDSLAVSKAEVAPPPALSMERGSSDQLVHQKTIFNYVSPFDALEKPVFHRRVSAPVINDTPSSFQSTPSSSSGIPTPSTSSSSDAPASTPSSGNESHNFTGLNSSVPEAPATLSLSTRFAGGMMFKSHTLSPDTARIASPENVSAVNMTPRATQLPQMDEASGVRSYSTSSSSTSSSSAHLALLDMVASEAEVISSYSRSSTPQPARGRRASALSQYYSSSGLAPGPRMTTDAGLMGVAGMQPIQAPPTHLHTSEYGNPGPIPARDIWPQDSGFNGYPRTFTPSQQNPASNPAFKPHVSIAPHLHHPHPLLHPQHLIRIPSASPSPLHRQPPPAPQASYPPMPFDPYGPRNGYGPPILPNAGMPPIQPPNSQFLNNPTSPLSRPPDALPMAQTGFQPGDPRLVGPRYPQAFNNNRAPGITRKASEPQMASSPNPNSFIVQKSQADRAELLNLIRSPNIAAKAPTANRRASVTAARAPIPSSVLESGLIPANVQFRNLTKGA